MCPENPQESRASKRVSVLLKGNYRIQESGFPFFVMTAVNISDSGICIATDTVVAPDCLVELNVSLPDKRSLALFGRTVWSEKLRKSDMYRTGVEILITHSEDFKKFKAYYQDQLITPPKITESP